LPFPISIDGSVKVKIEQDMERVEAAALSALEEGLRRARASTIERRSKAIVFSVNFFRLVWSTNLLVPIEGGRIDIASKEGIVAATYRVGTIRLLLICTLMALLGLAVTGKLYAAAIFWLWLFGANYLTAWIRFRALVRRSVAGTCAEWAFLNRTA